jgi:hypothetical protein
MSQLSIGAIIALCVLLVLFGPLLVIWSINVLFQTNTPYNLTTWFAAVVFISAIRAGIRESK